MTKITEVAQAIVDALKADAALKSYRESLRGGDGPGLTEHTLFPPRISNDRFQIPEADTPYFCVCGRDGDLLTYEGISSTSPIDFTRTILCVYKTQRPTYEVDAQLKELFELTMRVLASAGFLTSLQALGALHFAIAEVFVDALQSDDQAFFTIDVAPSFRGETL